MINYLSGRITIKKDKFIVLEVAGLGFKVFLSQKNISQVSEGKEIKLFTFLDVKETSLNLYGFLDYKELEFFEILETIRGVGPKAALEISALGPLERIKDRISANDEKLFEGVPGIGKKKAMTIVLELSGKIKNLLPKKEKQEADEAEETLVGLGFSRQKIKDVLKSIPKGIKDTEQKVKEALKILGQSP